MQCPDCGYISFKKPKVCGSCGFSFKKAITSATSLYRNDSFTIFAESESSAQDQESVAVSTTPTDSEEIAVMDPDVDSQENSDSESGEFILNLSDLASPQVDSISSTPDSDTMKFSNMKFGAGVDINLEEVAIEGLGLGLEPMDNEPSTPTTNETEPEENLLEVIDVSEPGQLEADDVSSDVPIEIDVEEEVDIMPSSSSEDEVPEIEPVELNEVSLDDPPEIEIINLNEVPLVESNDIENAEEDLEITLDVEKEEVHEPTIPVLDLGEDEISLQIDEDFEVESPAEPLPVEIDVLDLNLKIDDSDGPLATTNIENPEIEIEDLGLELEDPDPAPDPEKP